MALSSLLFLSSGRRRGAAWRPRRTGRPGVKEGGEILNFLAHLQSYCRSGPAAPLLFVHVMWIGNAGGQLAAALLPSSLPSLSSPPDTRTAGALRGKNKRNTHPETLGLIWGEHAGISKDSDRQRQPGRGATPKYA